MGCPVTAIIVRRCCVPICPLVPSLTAQVPNDLAKAETFDMVSKALTDGLVILLYGLAITVPNSLASLSSRGLSRLTSILLNVYLNVYLSVIFVDVSICSKCI